MRAGLRLGQIGGKAPAPGKPGQDDSGLLPRRVLEIPQQQIDLRLCRLAYGGNEDGKDRRLTALRRLRNDQPVFTQALFGMAFLDRIARGVVA